MNWKSDWCFICGNVRVIVRAINKNGRYQVFKFDCFLSDNICGYTRFEELSNIANSLSLLRGFSAAKIVAIIKN